MHRGITKKKSLHPSDYPSENCIIVTIYYISFNALHIHPRKLTTHTKPAFNEDPCVSRVVPVRRDDFQPAII